MPSRDCPRCGGNVRLVPIIAAEPELQCAQCGRVPPPRKPASNAASIARVAARIAPRRARVAKLYKQGVPPLTIAEQLGITQAVMYADLKHAGLSPGKRRISPATVKRIITMRHDGMTVTEIERALGVCHLTVQRHTTRAGIPTLTTQMAANKREAFRLYRALRPLGWSYKRIANRVGVSSATMHRWIHAAGLHQGDARTSRHRPPNAPKHP